MVSWFDHALSRAEKVATQDEDFDAVFRVRSPVTTQSLYLQPAEGGPRLLHTATLRGTSRLQRVRRATPSEAAIVAPATPLEKVPFVERTALPPTPRTPPVLPPPEEAKKTKKGKKGKKEEEDVLKGWHGLRRREMTPEFEREIRGVQLRGFADPKVFYRTPDLDMPKHFTFARVVGGFGEQGVGIDTRLPTNKAESKRKGKSLVRELLSDYRVEDFASRRGGAIQSEETSGGLREYRDDWRKRRKLAKQAAASEP
eukprot:Polyplicarium_translucidae@DN2302_c0_g1_i2.p1